MTGSTKQYQCHIFIINFLIHLNDFQILNRKLIFKCLQMFYYTRILVCVLKFLLQVAKNHFYVYLWYSALSKESSRTRASEILLKENLWKIVNYPKSFQFIDISNLRKQYRASRLSAAFGLIELLRFQYNHVIGQWFSLEAMG